MSRNFIYQILIGITGALLIFKNFLLLNSCGVEAGNPSTKKPKPPSVDVVSLVSDPQLTTNMVNASHGDAVAASADQASSGSGLNIRGDVNDQDTTVVERACVGSEDQKAAIVSVQSNINRTRVKTSKGGLITVSATRIGTGISTRTWSRSDGQPVACNSSGTGAAVNFQSPEGLKLDVSFQRNRNDTVNITRQGTTKTFAKNFVSSGQRIVSWSLNSSQLTAPTYVRSKSIIIKDVKQTLEMTTKQGFSVLTELTINTNENAPLVVEVERVADTHSVSTKKFVSGQLVVKKDSDATITLTYDNLIVDFAGNACSIKGGSAQILVNDSSGALLKTLILGAEPNSDGALREISGEEVEGFALDPCDSEDVRL